MEKIKEICETQKKIYVLQEVNRRKCDISRKLDDSIPIPVAPREIQYSYREIPDYDEEKYVKLAKAQGSGLGKFREGCIYSTYPLAVSVIGLIVIWVPLLLLILSFPYSIYNTRKKAYKLYIEDCKKLELENAKNKRALEDFNRASVKYQNDLQLYQAYLSNAKSRKKVFENEFYKVANEISNLNEKYIVLCDRECIAPIYRDFASINMIYSYLNDGQSNSVQEAIKRLQLQTSIGKISTNLEYIKKNYSLYQNSMPEVVKALKECNSYVDRIEKDLLECVKAVTNESENTEKTLLRKYISN